MSTSLSLLIRNVRVLDPTSGFDAIVNVGIRDGRVDYRDVAAPAATYDQTLDGSGRWLMPAAIDLAARFREPGETHKADFVSETGAAQAGGIGCVVLPPDTSPVIDSPAVVDRIRIKAEAVGGIDVQILGALTQGLKGEALASMSALKRAGCVGFSQALAPMRSALVARRALEYADGLGATVHVFAQDADLANGGCAHEGPVGTRLGLAPIPVAAEVAAIRLWISLVEDTGARVHFCRLSTASGATLIESAQARGLPVSADVAAHQLFMTEADLEGFDAMAHVIPPLRALRDRDGLREALKRGVIGTVCSDHQPHEPDAKVNPFPLTEPGIAGLETLLPLVLQLVHEQVLTPLQAAARLSLGPALVLGRAEPGVSPGASADLVLIDPEIEWTLDTADATRWHSRGRNTPFAGRRFRGRPVMTLYAGQIVWQAPTTI
ncbi:MAG: dihydroorotase [Hydrocarboniphaga sp.]|uniref:dihydroorotase n=1 Tax=Hydrocarboniphaga sp. TaxID=2033016 RepID=UPI00261421D9|nr:dihydroorotase [Hydrocarboniphaga sp.]MDB5971067.1 dihydroorotase [Hydrocarboniphaga sp.]